MTLRESLGGLLSPTRFRSLTNQHLCVGPSSIQLVNDDVIDPIFRPVMLCTSGLRYKCGILAKFHTVTMDHSYAKTDRRKENVQPPLDDQENVQPPLDESNNDQSMEVDDESCEFDCTVR